MILHIVLFTLNDGYTADSADVRSAVAATLPLAAEVPSLLSWRFGANIARRASAHDFAGLGLLDDEAALAAYLSDPYHTSVSRMWAGISGRATADLVVPALQRPAAGGLPYDLDLIKGD